MKPVAPKRKITVKLWMPLLQKLNDMTAAASLNRDAYLDRVFSDEVARMRQELEGMRNSEKACGFLKRCFAELKELRAVNFTFTQETADALTSTCDEVNVWRDAFVNRVIFLLVAKSEVVEKQMGFKFADHHKVIFDEYWDFQQLLLGPRLAAIGDVVAEDPFCAIRIALRNEDPHNPSELHQQTLGAPLAKTAKERGLVGFNVYLDDELVPGTAKRQEADRVWEELLGPDADEPADLMEVKK